MSQLRLGVQGEGRPKDIYSEWSWANQGFDRCELTIGLCRPENNKNTMACKSIISQQSIYTKLKSTAFHYRALQRPLHCSPTILHHPHYYNYLFGASYIIITVIIQTHERTFRENEKLIEAHTKSPRWTDRTWETKSLLTIFPVMAMRAVVVASMSSPPSVFCFKFRIRGYNVCPSTAKSTLQQDWGWLAVGMIVVATLSNHGRVWVFRRWDNRPWRFPWKLTHL